MNTPSDIEVIRPIERRLAVVTHWSVFGAFGMGFVLSGFSSASWGMGLLGYALLVAGFIGHVIINRMFDTGFTGGEIAFGLVAFGLCALCFIGSWLFDPRFGEVNLGIGLAGFAAMAACLVGYLVVSYGMRGSYRMIHSLRSERKAGA